MSEAAAAASTSENEPTDNERSFVVNLDDQDTCTSISTYLDSLTDEDLLVYVSATDFLQAATNAKPSISKSDLHEYEALEKAFDDRVGDIEATAITDTLPLSQESFKNGNNIPSKSVPLQKQTLKRSPNKLRDNHDQVYR